MTGLVGIEIALGCDALTFLVSAAILMRLPPLQGSDPQEPPRSKRELGFVAGLRYLGRRPYLAAILSVKSLMALGGGSLAMLPVFGTRVFEQAGGPGYVGLLYAARGLGALVGSMVVPRLFGDGPRAMRRYVAPALGIICLSHLALSRTTSIGEAAVAYFGTAVGGGLIWVASGTLGQLAAANRYRGRVFSLEWGMMTLVLSAVAALAGWLVDHAAFTVRDVAMTSGLMILLPLMVWLGLLRYLRQGESRLRREREQPPAGVEPAALTAAHARWRERWTGEGTDEG